VVSALATGPTVLEVTMVGNVTMETKLCSLLQLNNATDTAVLNDVRQTGDSVFFQDLRFLSAALKRYSCYINMNASSRRHNLSAL
jgi:hypothetical protein